MVRIGISGWRYEPWREVFYPKDLAQKRELEFASRALSTIEINGSFYSLQRPESWQAWHDETPEDFVFAVKGPRYITHLKRLREIDKPLANFYASGVLLLRAKLGPFLWQFPPHFRFDAALFDAFFAKLPRTTAQALALARRRDPRMHGRSALRIDADRPLRHAVEVRHDSFRDPAFLALLRRHGFAVVVADTAGKWPLFEEVTADFLYLRLHGDEELYVSGYTPKALDEWAERIRRWRGGRDVYCYFDNDVKVHAPFDAIALARRLGAPVGPNARERPPLEVLEEARIGWPAVRRSRRRDSAPGPARTDTRWASIARKSKAR